MIVLHLHALLVNQIAFVSSHTQVSMFTVPHDPNTQLEHVVHGAPRTFSLCFGLWIILTHPASENSMIMCRGGLFLNPHSQVYTVKVLLQGGVHTAKMLKKVFTSYHWLYILTRCKMLPRLI